LELAGNASLGTETTLSTKVKNKNNTLKLGTIKGVSMFKQAPGLSINT